MELRDLTPRSAGAATRPTGVQRGRFSVRGGIVEREREPETLRLTHNSDVYITANLAVGEAIDGTETFTDTTILLEEEALRVRFDDLGASGPDNDWAFIVNDASGSAEYFALEDSSAGTTPLYVAAGAPDDALHIDASGRYRIGTATPSASVHVVANTGTNAAWLLDRPDGATGLVSAGGAVFTVGAITDHPLQLLAGSDAQAGWKLKLHPDRSLEMRSGASCSAGGVWTDNAALATQRQVRALELEEAEAALAGLNPIRFRHVLSPGDEVLGFTAEELPDLVATADRRGVRPTEIAALLVRVVQGQAVRIAAQEARLREQDRELVALREGLARQEERLRRLERP